MIGIKMSILSNIFVALSILCYTAMSSLAAVHAFPAMDGMGSSPQISLPTQISVADNSDMAESLMSCHQVAETPAEQLSGSSICKIFCSAIGLALLTFKPLEMVSAQPHTSPHSRINRYISTQTSVDHQPPR